MTWDSCEIVLPEAEVLSTAGWGSEKSSGGARGAGMSGGPTPSGLSVRTGSPGRAGPGDRVPQPCRGGHHPGSPPLSGLSQLVRYSAEGLLQLGPLGSTSFLPDSKCLVDDGRTRTPALKKCEDVARPAQRLWDFTQVRGWGHPAAPWASVWVGIEGSGEPRSAAPT